MLVFHKLLFLKSSKVKPEIWMSYDSLGNHLNSAQVHHWTTSADWHKEIHALQKLRGRWELDFCFYGRSDRFSMLHRNRDRKIERARSQTDADILSTTCLLAPNPLTLDQLNQAARMVCLLSGYLIGFAESSRSVIIVTNHLLDLESLLKYCCTQKSGYI